MLSRSKMRIIVDRKAIRKEAKKLVESEISPRYCPRIPNVAKAIVEEADRVHASNADVLVTPLTGADLICKIVQKIIKKKYNGKKIPIAEWEKNGKFNPKSHNLIKNAKKIFVLDDAHRPILTISSEAEDIVSLGKTKSFFPSTYHGVLGSITKINPDVPLTYEYLSDRRSLPLENAQVPHPLRSFAFYRDKLEESKNETDYYQVNHNIGILYQLIHKAKTPAERQRLTAQLKDELVLLEAHKEYKRRLQKEIDKLLVTK